MNFPTASDLDTPKKRSSLYIKKRYPEFYQFILQRYPHINKFNAGVYLYFRNMEHPKCPMCGTPVPFLDETRGFQHHCSSKCANSDPEFRKKVEQTCIKKYGTKVPSQSKQVKDKLIKTYTKRHGGMGNASQTVRDKQQATMQSVYGVKHALQNDSLKEKAVQTTIMHHGGIGTGSKDIREKIEATNLERYGVSNVFGSKDIREKIEATNLERYGSKYVTRNAEVAQKISSTKSKTFVDSNPDIISIQKIGNQIIYLCECPHPECELCESKQYEIQAERYCNRKLDGTEPCTNILPVINGRTRDTYPEIFVRSVLIDLVPKGRLKYNDRTLIAPKEVDIYDPIRGIAFECNGCYWHSRKETSYHKTKYLNCQQRGVQLLTIWEDWIKNKPDIVRSIIRAKYHHFDRTIYGRKCKINIVSSGDAAAFLDKNHIQGATRAIFHYGLYNDDELVAIMSFSKMRGCMGSQTTRTNQWELVRFCSALNTQVIGAADKLLKHFITTHQPSSIVSFSSNDISDGSLYRRLGFEKGNINKSYWYVGIGYKRYHRSNFTKTAIIRKGMAPEREHWTETEVMLGHGFVKIYDSGQTKWALNLK